MQPKEIKMSGEWSNVTEISTSTSAGSIFSNGLHMITINVKTISTDKDLNPVIVDPTLLQQNISLIDYDADQYNNGGGNLDFIKRESFDIDDEMSAGWFYTTEPNEFTSSYLNQRSDTNGQYQTTTFYVFTYGTSGSGRKSIGVKITPKSSTIDPNATANTIYFNYNNNPNNKDFASVMVNTPITYYAKDVERTWTTYPGDNNSDGTYTNYSLRPIDKQYIFVKSRLYGPAQDLANNYVAHKIHDGGNGRFLYMWDIGQKVTNNKLGLPPYTTATVNQNPGTFNFTRSWQQNKRE